MDTLSSTIYFTFKLEFDFHFPWQIYANKIFNFQMSDIEAREVDDQASLEVNKSFKN
jgi:hypothetical protein